MRILGRLLSDPVAAFERACPMIRSEIKRLKERRWILQYIRTGGIGAEIGVFRGHFSELICKIAKPRKLYLVDPWTTAGETFGWGDEYTNFGRLRTADARDEALARCARYPATEIVVIEANYPNDRDRIVEPLDFAYLDAGHSYEATRWELPHIAQQMKPGGIIIGDDWMDAPDAQHHGVFRAIQEFVRETDWQLIAAGPGTQWALRRQVDHARPPSP